MRRLLAVPVLLLAAATPALPADAPPPAEATREGDAAVGERLARIERILWERDAGAIPTLRDWAAKDASGRVRERALGALVTLRDTKAPRVYFDRLASDPVLLFGLGVLLGSISLISIFTPLFILLNLWELKAVEERELEKRLGRNYVEYKRRTPMFIPRLKVRIKEPMR